MKSASDVSILFVDDEPEMLNSLRRFLRKEPYQTRFANSGREALDILATQPIDIIVSDLRMPEMDGLSLLKRVKSSHPEVMRLVLSATQDMEQTITAINTGEVYRFMTKPLEPEVFKSILRDTVDHLLLITGRGETMVEIEKRLLQSSPPRDLHGADIAALLIPSGQMNGDFTDYFVYNPQQVDILVGDVMGKGVQAALAAAAIKHRFAKSLAVADCRLTPRMSCPQLSYKAEHFDRIISWVQAECIEELMGLEMFCTLDFARLDLTNGRLHLFDLGHCPVIHFHAETGDCTLLKSNNMALGMVKEPEYHAVTASVNPGDVLLFHTDGVTETQSVAGEMFGVERLAEKVRANHHLPAAQLIETIRTGVAVFSGRGRFDDDFTCIAVRIESV